MILKIGMESGFEYIQTKGNVKIKSYDVMDVLNTIASKLENKIWKSSDSEFTKQIMDTLLKNWKKNNPEKDEKLFDKRGSLIHYITQYVTSCCGIIKSVNLEEMIEDISKGCGYHSNIVAMEYANEEFNQSNQAIIMYNHNPSYLLNDEGKTIDIIR